MRPHEVYVPPEPLAFTCPECGSDEGVQEEGKRLTWQPLTLTRGVDGNLEAGDYSEFDYADDVEVTGFACRSCQFEWQTLAGLDHAMSKAAERESLIAALEEAREFVNTSPHVEVDGTRSSTVVERIDALLARSEQTV